VPSYRHGRRLPDDESDTPLEHIRFLSRAESRVRTVQRLLESEPATQRELRTRLDASRTTVARSLSSLAERGWIERTEGAYRLTHAGRVVAEEFSRLLGSVAAVDELAEFLRWFPADVETPDILGATDVEVTYSTDGAPYAPAGRQTEILHDADRLRILLPAIDLDSTRTITEQVTERGLEVETVVSPAVEATLEAEEFASPIRRKIRSGRSTMYVSPEPLPFYLGLADDGRVQPGSPTRRGSRGRCSRPRTTRSGRGPRASTGSTGRRPTTSPQRSSDRAGVDDRGPP
jgi:predicted transcriptional regulator